MAVSYDHYSTLSGPLQEPDPFRPVVRYRPVMSGRERAVLAGLILLNVALGGWFLSWLLRPEHVPGGSGALRFVAWGGLAVIVLVECIRLASNATTWLYAAKAVDPVPVTPPSGLRVAVLTTIVPSKEPFEMVAETLQAMRRLEYDGQVDVWLLDEGDDPDVRRRCPALGVHHFSRKGRPEYNQPEGPFRTRTKSGNHNAWRAEHEQVYDLVAQMDPDHVPLRDFLTRTLGYFRDPDVAFVVAPQVYGNLDEGWLTGAAASQSYQFHGVTQRGANGLGAPLLIGTNHVYRTSAWRQIGGYQDSIIEDHLTSLHVHGAVNPSTGRRWTGVYTPDIVAVGEGPTSWTDYFNQQKRWAYGVWEVVTTHASTLLARLSPAQRLSYAGLQFFYPSLALLWVLGNAATALYLLLGVTVVRLDAGTWITLWGATVAAQLALFLWLRRFNLARHERRELGLSGIALSLLTGPVYVAAAAAALTRRPLTYAVTAKGALASGDSTATFRAHIGWALAAAGALIVSIVLGHDHLPLRAWAVVTLTAALVPPAWFLLQRRPAADVLAATPEPAADRGAEVIDLIATRTAAEVRAGAGRDGRRRARHSA